MSGGCSLPGRARRPPADEDLREHNKRGRIPSLPLFYCHLNRLVGFRFTLVIKNPEITKKTRTPRFPRFSIQWPGILDRNENFAGITGRYMVNEHEI